ncbi:PAS domain-containing sensor histidine kinase [Sphaerisporangium sp. TRM90804]|uniref:PAS domain-containing sensor histidine kinase n=1 Tax=Sphaerisporangium sp. TRM90804 TaxID=3031113 RepID=UPI00244A57AD|nr:PAS domain-containing sensor histidine kinase [Sphaerisporangium sp. TRM90804]MDH2429359.1 PAS domain-containing sensor histidine kinase [Sphaerisporangium sp. TRM90804]
MATSDDWARYGFSAELSRALFQDLRVGMYVVGHTGKILLVNPYAEILLDRPARHLIGAEPHDLLHRNADGSPIAREDCQILAGFAEGMYVRSEEAWFTRGSGGLIPLGVMSAPLPLGGGQMGNVVLFYDLSQHKAVEHEQAAALTALEKLTDRLSLMAETSTVLASALRVDEALRRLSRLVVPRLADWAMIDLLGPSGEGVYRVVVVVKQGRNGVEYKQWEGPLPAFSETSQAPMARVLRGGPAVLLGPEDVAEQYDHEEYSVERRRPFAALGAHSVIVAPLRTPRRVLGALTLARYETSLVYDSTDLSLIGDIASRAGLAVDNANMFEEQRRFASSASHELRTPLTGLRAQLEEAVLYPADIDPHETIRKALAVTDRLETIVDDLLVLARLHAGEPAAYEPIDVGALVSKEVAAMAGGVPLHVDADRDVHVLGNRIQLIRVVDNLLVNARRHADTQVEVTVGRAKGSAVITVCDDGAGIAPQDRECVFKRFVRLDEGRRREPGGSGLGLAISRDIAQAHNGTLTIEDSPRGARFVLRLPLTDRRP